MRQACLLFTVLLCAAMPAAAQITVDLQALDALKGARPATRQPAPHRTAQRRNPTGQITTAKPGKPQQEPATTTPAPTSSPPVAASAPATPPPATLPNAPPSTVALAPIAPPPPPVQAAPPPPPPISDDAVSAAAATGTGLRVTFGTGQADLSPASAAAIKSVVQSVPQGDNVSFNVVAYAAGTPEDPSTARRLSLSRALAVRSVLMAGGVSSSRIFVRALGAAAGEDAPDRVDLAVLGGNAAPPDSSAKSQSP
jgi:outer membrane protein OmpA-like peptidoglycan-associated protein